VALKYKKYVNAMIVPKINPCYVAFYEAFTFIRRRRHLAMGKLKSTIVFALD